MPNKLSRFWQELKRRNVVRVITVYGGAAFVIIELINNITEPLRLPDWTPTLVIVLLAIGFPIVIIFSWIYDVHPEGGIVKTESVNKLEGEQTPKPSNSWKIASYISFVVIVGLIVLNIFGGNRGPRIDKSLAKSIAVLPFINMSGEDEREFICDGLTEEVINNLFKVGSFDKVAPYSNVKIYKDSEKNLTEIAEELGVNYLLESSYKRMGVEIEITPRLINSGSDIPIWSDDYELPYDEVLGIPGEIALQIANNLGAIVSEDVRKSIDRDPTNNIKAYEYLRQAMEWGETLLETTLTWDQRMELTEKAIELDPDYADAYAYRGFLIMTANAGNLKSAYLEVEPFVNKALGIDPYNITANWVLAAIDIFIKWDYVKGEEVGSKYETYFISDSTLMLGTILFRLDMGMFERVLSIVKEDSYWGIRTLIFSGDTSYARVLFNRRNVLDEDPPEDWAALYIYFQEFDSAIICFKSIMEDERSRVLNPKYQADLAVAYYKTGQVDQAERILSKLIQESDTNSERSPAYFVGKYYSWIGKPDSAFYWLEKAVRNHSVEIPNLKVDPAFKSLKEDPHYWDLYERTGFKAYDEYMARQNQ